MIRWLGLAAFIALLPFCWLLFELANVWPINRDGIPALRALFAAFVLLATAAFLCAPWRLLSAALLLGAFVTTTLLSNAAANLCYFVSAGAIVLSVAVLSRLFGKPLKVR